MLNNNQQLICDKAVDWYYNSSSTLFQIDGEAGTGKSYLINNIVEKLGLRHDRILSMAYTGQAALVMRRKGLINSVTCHSGLFEFQQTIVISEDGTPLMDKELNIPIVKEVFLPKHINYNDYDLIIIDEAYMIPKSFRKYIDNTNIKTIVTGDSGQLPPVEDEPAYLIDGEIHHLTELMRQSEYSPIVYLARRARNGMDILPGTYGQTVVCFVDEIKDIYRYCFNSDISLCGKNMTRENINNNIRKNILNTDSPTPLYNERVICKKNNWRLTIDNIPLVNGLVGNVSNSSQIYYDRGLFLIDFKPNLLNKSFIDLKCDYDYIRSDYKSKQDMYRFRYNKGEKFDYAYASTVHTAQGSEYDSGIYIEEYLGGNIMNNLNYTAITRFRNNLLYIKNRRKYY